MRMLRVLKAIPVAAVLSMVIVKSNLAQVPAITISPNLTPNPLVLNGKSGGTQKTNCGNISATPSQVIRVSEPMPNLKLTVEGDGQPTLLIDGPGGRYCILADSYSQRKPELSGYWPAGIYSLYIGELSQKEYSYTLSISISQQQKPK